MSNRNQKKAIQTAKLSIVGNLVLAIAKGITGILGNSFALVADAIESTTDVFSSCLVLLGLNYSSRPPDENHPYGHGKIEPLITFLVVGFLLISATFIVIEAIDNIRTPQETPAPYTLIVLAVIIVIKELFYRLVKKRGKETHSTSLIADAWHHRSDALTSLTAFIGISIALILGPGYEKADDWAALFAAGFIVYNAYIIFRPALSEIMDEHFHDDLIKKVRVLAKTIPEIRDTEKCFIRKSGMSYFVDLHMVVDGSMSVYDGHDVAHKLKDVIRAELPEITDVLIHIEPDKATMT